MFLLNLLDDMLFAAIPAVGFALVFNVPPKALKYCAILGALGHVTRTLLLHFGVPIVFATFFATCVIWFSGQKGCANSCQRRWYCDAGKFGYRALCR